MTSHVSSLLSLQVSDQKPLGSWAVRHGQRITCPAVYNHSTGEYVVLHDDKVNGFVVIWRRMVTRGNSDVS